MLKNTDELIQAAAAGTLLEHRHENLELKESWDFDDGQDISALANKRLESPCFFVIGVADDGSLCRRPEAWARKVEQTISQHLNSTLNPSQACDLVSCQEIDGSWLVIVTISNPGAVVYWGENAYKAAGTTSSKMRPEEILELTVTLPGLTDRSVQPWTGDTNPHLINVFCDLVAARLGDPIFQRGESSPDELLLKLGVRGKVAARQLFGDYRFRIVYHDSEGVPIENNEGCGLFSILDPAFREKIQTWTKNQNGATDDPYPPKALKEALANAVAHAAYYENDGEIIIELFSDRISISNLSLPECRVFANKWFSRSHKTINRFLMETLRLAGLVDELGRGKSVIFSESIRAGIPAPLVVLEPAGRYNRWRLVLHGGSTSPIQLRLLDRIRDIYGDEQKSLLAFALVLWRDEPVAKIRQFVDGESLPLFRAVLSDLRGPIFYYEAADQIILRRWTRILLGEGKNSKALTVPEEEDLLRHSRDLHMKYNQGIITPKELRGLAAMGETASEKSQSSNLLAKWRSDGHVKSVKRGVYKFTRADEILNTALSTFLAKLSQPADESEGADMKETP